MRNMETGVSSQHKRFMRPDAGRFLRPDAMRFIRPDAARFVLPNAKRGNLLPGIDSKYSPSQPRIPAGRTGGGRWTDGREDQGGGARPAIRSNIMASEPGEGSAEIIVDGDGLQSFDADETIVSFDGSSAGGESSWIVTDFDADSLVGTPDGSDAEQPDIFQVAQRSRSFTDKYGDPYYSPGGHHEMPQSIFRKWDLSPETRRVFDDATTGSLPKDKFRTSPDGVPRGHLWDEAHGLYNQAVTELSDNFVKNRNIRPDQMTPDQAWELLGQIRESQDPRIRDYNSSLRLLRRLNLFRSGRGSQ